LSCRNRNGQHLPSKMKKALALIATLSAIISIQPVNAQIPNASYWTNYNLKLYKQNPDWGKLSCYGFKKANENGISIYSNKYYEIDMIGTQMRHPGEVRYIPTKKEHDELNIWVASNYCTDAW